MSWVLDLSILLSICRVYICLADYVELPVLLYLLQFLVYHMLSKMRRSSGIYIQGSRWGIGVTSTGVGVWDSTQQLYMNQTRCNWCVAIVLLSIWYNVCACHSPVYDYIAATVVYLVQCIIAARVVVIWFYKRLQSLYLSMMNSQRGCWVVWKSSNTR